LTVGGAWERGLGEGPGRGTGSGSWERDLGEGLGGVLLIVVFIVAV